MKNCKNEALLLRILVRKRKLATNFQTATSPPGVAGQMAANRFVSFSVPLFEAPLEPYRGKPLLGKNTANQKLLRTS